MTDASFPRIADEAERASGDIGKPPEDRSPRPAPQSGDRPGFFASVFGRMRPRVPAVLRDEIADALLKVTGAAAFSPEERAMLDNILRLKEVRVEDVMVPRAEIDAIEITATLGELMHEFEESGHSRMPVYGEHLDDPRGMVHIRDVVAHITRAAQSADLEKLGRGPDAGLDLRRIDLALSIGELELVRPVLFVPPSMMASNLMARMQATRTQMALVIDEYGGTDGLVSLEDIIEMVVGNIEDEHDDEEVLIAECDDGSFDADARADLHDVKRLVGADFDISGHVEEADTIGGLLFTELGRVPIPGEVVEAVPGFEFQVLDADTRRVRRVRISRLRRVDPAAALSFRPADTA